MAVDVAAFWELLTGIGWYLYRLIEHLADRDDLLLDDLLLGGLVLDDLLLDGLVFDDLLLGGPGDVLLAQQDVQVDQQIQVNVLEVHSALRLEG